ncbi:aberrant lateral root formation 4 [Raphanus sativus]|uniref:Aberrant root formation protein 4 isoform X1 n=1 Tax=Raphanus sativus TaxID=3726 RepID=A0A6J0K4U2_RAPSA|nr:aberrant root formation protein 4 isoform X1 [Raphanus sativus]KAJ4883051.1 aberrant lateral root formation 4 [Raphanus sativus]
MSAATVSYSSRVRELLAGSLSSVEAGESQDLESLVIELVHCLNSLSENLASNASDDDEQENDANSNAGDEDHEIDVTTLNEVIQVLDDILKFLSSPLMNQDVMDALSFELPKVISKFAGLSGKCLELAEEIVDRFVEACNPRDMLSVLCEALDAARVSLSLSTSSTPLLHGLSKVFISVRRRHYEQLKVAVPIVLNVLKDMSLEPNMQVEGLFDKALAIGVSIKAVASKLEKEEGTKVCCLLGLYVMQITAVLSVSIKDKVDSGVPLVMQLKPLLAYCGLTHLGLITGNDAERLTSTVSKDDDDNDFLNSFHDINLGASLLFIWGRISPEVADVASDVNELQSNPVKRWQAYGMLKHILASGDLLWEFKRHTVEVLLEIVRGATPSQCNVQIDCSQYTTSIYSALQAVTLVIMYAPDADLRKKTFEALKRIISDIPVPQRFDVLKALVTNSQSSTMRGILLDQVRNNIMSTSSLQATDCDAHVTELVELVLKPPHGGPPLFPDQSDEVLAALNLYRFALLNNSRESEAGKETSSSSGFLSKKTLERDYKGWLLPLRTIVSGSIAENQRQKDQDQESSLEILCILNRIESLLYWCIELVEERLKSS